MTAPTPEVRIDWRNVGFDYITNDGFETDTSGWSIAGGAWNSAAVSLTRTAGGYAGSYCGELTTTLTQYSGCKYDLGTTSFASGRTYRFRLAMKRVSGTTSAIIRVGSAGLTDDAFAAVTLTTSWAIYSVDWTPSATRTDVECAVMTNAAATLVVDLDHVEVFEVIQDVTSLVVETSWTRGASGVGGGTAMGSAVLVVRNDDHRFDPANTSGPYGTNVRLNRSVWIRSTYNGAPRAHFLGSIQRVALRPEERLAEIHCADMFDRLERADTSVVASRTRSVRTFRGLVLDDVGIAAAQRSLDASDPEGMITLTEADQQSALAVLDLLNEATGTVHWIEPHVSASVLCRYYTRSRPALVTGSPVQAFSGTAVGIGSVVYDIDDVVNVMRVTPMQRGLQGTETVWQSERVPLAVRAGQSRTLWADYPDPTFSQAVQYVATGSPTVTLTPFSRSGKIVITAGASDALITELSVEGEPYEAADQEIAEYTDPPSVTEYWARLPAPRRKGYYGRPAFVLRYRRTPSTVALYDRREAELSSDYLPSTAQAEGLASWYVYRYAEPPIRPAILVRANDPGTQVAREVGDIVSLSSTSLSLSSVRLIITNLATRVGPAGDWVTTYQTEQLPAAQTWFTIDGTADQGIDGTGILAY